MTARQVRDSALASCHQLLASLYSELLIAETERERFEIEDHIATANQLARVLTYAFPSEHTTRKPRHKR